MTDTLRKAMTDPTAAAREKARKIAHEAKSIARLCEDCGVGDWQEHSTDCEYLTKAIVTALLAAEKRGRDAAVPAWEYVLKPTQGDARKIVTLEQDGMRWVGIRAWHAGQQIWLNNNEPEKATVIGWINLPEPARGYWQRGMLIDPATQRKESDDGK